MSSIVREIDRVHNAGLASMAYFYFDFRDSQKRHRRGLLSSLLSQLSADSDLCYHILSRLYSAHAGGTRQPSDDALWKCLGEMLKVQGRPPIYIIIDALDECPNISGMPTAREKVLKFLKDLVDLRLPNVHICVSSRPEIDIRTILEPLAPFRVSLDDESGQKEDVLQYIKSVVHSDQRLRRWSVDHKQLVIDTLSHKADGMFRWVYCQLEDLRQHFPENLQSALDHMPESLDETYERTLLGIDKAKRQYASRLFQCLTVSARPLRVDELAEILAIRFDAAAVPNANTVWQPINAEEDMLSACSSLIIIVDVNGSQVVQFAHISVKEFLTSDRLSTASENLSHYHIVPHFAHATLAQASLSVLLQLDDRIDEDSIGNFPLADYAARYWFKHGRFENVSSTIQEATERLFDRKKPHFSAWIWIYDMDDPWRKSMPTKHPERPEATPLYYAILCGFHWLIERLVVTYPGDVNARGGRYETPLLTAVWKENGDTGPLHRTSPSRRVDVVQLLLEHNADVNCPDQASVTPLHAASTRGKLEISRLLVKRGANVNCRDDKGRTPLRSVSYHGHLDVAQLLIDSGADVDACDYRSWTPLHAASWQGRVNIVELLIQHGADVNKQDNYQVTPLYLASTNGKLDILRLLIQRGADMRHQDKDGWTPLRRALEWGHLDVVRFLIDSGADVNSRDNQGWTPLHSASQEGHVDIVELLIQHGADVNTQSDHQATPLFPASLEGKLESSWQLVKRGVDVNSMEDSENGWTLGWTPLQVALYSGHLDVAQFLIDGGADVNSRGDKSWTPLHSAAGKGHLDIVKLLLRSGADFNIRTDGDRTPWDLASDNGNPRVADFLSGHRDTTGLMSLDGAVGTALPTISRHLNSMHPPRNSEDVTSSDEQRSLYTASQNGELDIVRSLLDRGTDINERSTFRATALDVASRYGKVEVVKLLIECGADVDSRDRAGLTPLITALQNGQFEVAQLLLDYGADVNVDTEGHHTALHLALSAARPEFVRLLLERGAKVDVPDVNGQTPRQLAIHLGYRKIAEMFSGFDEHGKGVTVQLSSSISSQGSPSPHFARASTLGISADAPVPGSVPPTPAPATQFADDLTVPALTSSVKMGPVKSCQKRLRPVSNAFDRSHVYRCFVLSHGETALQPGDGTSRDPYREKSVGDQLQPMITAVTTERNKAARAAQWRGWALNVAIASQVLVGAMALGATLGGQDIWVAISILCGVSTFLATYLARTYGSDERRASLLRVKALDHFLREIEAFQLIHGHEVLREWDEKIDDFRLGLENMLGNQPGSNSEAAGINLSVEKGFGATNPVSDRGSDGTRYWRD
ncbi:ankyrin repeat-containing domain protein [Lactarius hatsudake]|nr:ankyrin repeat-containing domain protein [Lactarius hatsudake]